MTHNPKVRFSKQKASKQSDAFVFLSSDFFEKIDKKTLFLGKGLNVTINSRNKSTFCIQLKIDKVVYMASKIGDSSAVGPKGI